MTVLFLGPLPPPVHGFSTINQAMLDQLRQHTEVAVFDRSGNAAAAGALPRPVAKILQWVALLRRFLRAAAQNPASLYAGLSGGFGQAIDLPFFLLARMRGVPITLHHHSYAYLNQGSLLAALVFRVCGGATKHICLCADMAEKLQEGYGVSKHQIVVLSNAAFMGNEHNSSAAVAADLMTRETSGLIFGFLSNITSEKGIFAFFAASDAIREKVPGAKGLIAGPVASDIASQFKQELQARPWLEHVGPVYADAKVAFYQRIDLLLFPTRYQNEAEPVTILEAMQAGVAVVAATRGCIAGMLQSTGDCCASCAIEDFAAQAQAEAEKIAKQAPEDKAVLRRKLSGHFFAVRWEAQQTLTTIIQSLSRPA